MFIGHICIIRWDYSHGDDCQAGRTYVYPLSLLRPVLLISGMCSSVLPPVWTVLFSACLWYVWVCRVYMFVVLFMGGGEPGGPMCISLLFSGFFWTMCHCGDGRGSGVPQGDQGTQAHLGLDQKATVHFLELHVSSKHVLYCPLDTLRVS